jgi:hypothetical protein
MSIFIKERWFTNEHYVKIRLDCELPSHRLHCLPILVYTYQLPEWSVSCLLLALTGNLRGQFRRYGFLHVFSPVFGMEDWTNFREMKSQDWLEYGAFYGNTYALSII